ncbi:hypothetical protein V3481_017109 [Fusarium oxysporum f. sp. vasinfectum]
MHTRAAYRTTCPQYCPLSWFPRVSDTLCSLPVLTGVCLVIPRATEGVFRERIRYITSISVTLLWITVKSWHFPISSVISNCQGPLTLLSFLPDKGVQISVSASSSKA